MPRFKTVTLGCKVNQSESDSISSRLRSAGWRQAGEHESADLCILNTCAVTGRASQQSRQAVRHAIRSNPTAQIIVTGCYAQVEPEKLSQIQGVHKVVGHDEKLNIPDKILSDPDAGTDPALSTDNAFVGFDQNFSSDRTRPFLKIQDGCDAYCTYCIVPYARGHSRSMPMGDVLENLRLLKAAGYREVVFTGIHLGCYGLDFKPQKKHLVDLLTLVENSDIIDRVRLSSIEPLELVEPIIRLAANSKCICPHFHIPLQSGDDEILKRMHRPYTAEQFRVRVLKIHQMMPDAAIGVDALIGFPGESETAFENTYRLIETLPISYLHVFPFSPRKGTPASRYPDPVPVAVIKERCRRVRRLGAEKKAAFYRSFLGKRVTVLIEGMRDPATGYLKGMTSNYVAVTAEGPESLKNTFVNISLQKLFKNQFIIGTITNSDWAKNSDERSSNSQ